jgi:hypothetical protein
MRITSDLYVSQLMRRMNASGGFAAVLKKGAAEGGTIYICVRSRAGALSFYAPAPQNFYTKVTQDERYFYLISNITNDAHINTFLLKETLFDKDFWTIELEPVHDQSALLFELAQL